MSTVSTGTTAPTVVRARLVDEVLAAAPGAPCLISAPRGYGRSTLLRQAAAAAGEARVLHLKLTASDSPPHEQLQAAARAAHADDVRWILIDDDTGSGDLAGDRWADVVDEVCRGAGLVISSEASLDEIALRFPRSAILDRRDLAFTAEEASAVLTTLAPGADPADVAAVVELSEGWVAPIVLAAARLRRGRHESVAGWLHAVGAEIVVDPWWRTLTPAQQRFLLDTVVLDDLDPAACDAIREADDSKVLLREITRREGLVVRDVTARAQPTWRRHRLLTEALIANSDAGPEALLRHERAAAFYLRSGQKRTAIQHLIEAGQYRDAGMLLRELENALFTSDQADLALNWYAKLNQNAWDSTAEHELRVGWASLWTGDTTTARQCLARLRASLASPALPDADGADILLLRGEANLLEAYLAGSMADTTRMVALAREAVAAFVGHGEANSHQLAPVLVARGLLWEGRVEDAVAALGTTCVVDLSSDFVRELSARGVQAGCAAAQGHMHEAAAIVAAVQGFVTSHGGDDVMIGHSTLAVAQARVWLEAGHIERACDYLMRVEEAAAQRSAVGALTHARLQRCAAAIRVRDTAEALDIVQLTRGELRATNPNSGMWSEVDRLHARALLGAGDTAGAEAVVRHLPPSQQKTMLAAWALVAQRPAQVVRALTELRPNCPRAAVERRFLLAQASYLVNPAHAGPHLRRGAEIAQRHGLTGLIVEHPRLWPQVEADPSGQVRVLAARLANAGGPVAPDHAVTESPGPAVPRLSRGEVALLARLPSRATQNQLAEEFGVSPNTIKTRLRRLYRKLDVSGRDEAISVARTHNLLPPED